METGSSSNDGGASQVPRIYRELRAYVINSECDASANGYDHAITDNGTHKPISCVCEYSKELQYKCIYTFLQLTIYADIL